MSRPLIADGAEVFIDAKHDEDEFGGDTRKNDSDHYAGDRGQQQNESAERADRHLGQAGKNAADAKQADQRDHQPVEGLDDGGRDKAVPLKQIPKFKHRSFSPSTSNTSSLVRTAQGLAPNVAPGKSGTSTEGAVLAGRARAMRVGGLRMPAITA